LKGHPFIFQPGRWIGEGKVSFNVSPDRLLFSTEWEIEEMGEGGIIHCTQTVEMQGVEEVVTNAFEVSRSEEEGVFDILLTNESIERVEGNGVVDAEKIAWEFRGHEAFEGFEVYEKQSAGDYMLHAEYGSSDQFRTIIDGRIWRKE